MFTKLRVMRSHGWQTIPDLTAVELSAPFRGRPEISPDLGDEEARRAGQICPTGAFKASPVSLDLGKCVFCGECQRCTGGGVRFTTDFRMATNVRQNLIINPEHKR